MLYLNRIHASRRSDKSIDMTYRYPSTTTVDNQLNTQIHGINAVLYDMRNRYFPSPSTDRLHSRGYVAMNVLYALEAYLGCKHSPRELVFPVG